MGVWAVVFSVFLVTAGVMYAVLEYRRFSREQSLQANLSRLHNELAAARKEAQSYAKAHEYLAQARQAVTEQIRSFVARVEREGVHVQSPSSEADKPQPQGANAGAKPPVPVPAVMVHFIATYTFGFEGKADVLEVATSAKGIDIRINRPVQLLPPIVRPVSHAGQGTAQPTEKQAAVIKTLPVQLEQQAANRVLDDAVLALLEKQVVDFVRIFLAHQAGVKQVPAITLTYR